MKIYFAGSIKGGREDTDTYLKLINYLKKYGDVLTEHVGDKSINEAGESLPSSNIYERDIRWLRSADLVLAEITTPSTGVGYELRAAEELKKKVLCLYNSRTKSISSMISGNSYFTVKKYDEITDAFRHIDDFLNKK
jgi:nucleoside 2-deoxyribosyltransferase